MLQQLPHCQTQWERPVLGKVGLGLGASCQPCTPMGRPESVTLFTNPWTQERSLQHHLGKTGALTLINSVKGEDRVGSISCHPNLYRANLSQIPEYPPHPSMLLASLSAVEFYSFALLPICLSCFPMKANKSLLWGLGVMPEAEQSSGTSEEAD